MNRLPVLALLGCLFWLMPLVLSSLVVRKYGFFSEAFYLLGIPAGMIALTIIVWRFPRDSRYRGTMIVASSLVATLAGIYWLSIWGAGV